MLPYVCQAKQRYINNKTHNTMKKYNYTHNGQIISKAIFITGVPMNWEKEVNEYGEYSYGYFKATLRD
jgi:hypothetical protein